MNGLRILLLLAVASPLLALWPRDQDPAATDWAKEVERACTSPRYGLRLAAARKVAKGGAAAVPAIRAFAAAKGRNELPAALVDAIADETTVEPEVLALLREWAATRDFYWRASALRGLALRVEAVPAGEFPPHHGDPSWLMRTHARLGSALRGDTAVLAQPEPDPRARARLPSLLLARGVVPPLQPLLDALADERTFQGDPWAQRQAADAHKALKTWLGDAHPLAAGGSFPDAATGLQQLLAACAAKSGQQLLLPATQRDPQTGFAGGIEILSCQHGDQFVQWTDAGVVHFDLDAAGTVALPAAAWRALSQERTALGALTNHGVVVCDSMRLRWPAPDVHVRIAPGSAPAALSDWLKQLTQALEEAGAADRAAALRTGFSQFAAR